MYQYQARLVRAVDGDTLVLDLDLGFYQWRLGRSYRLARINAPERGIAGATEATLRLFDICNQAKTLMVQTAKADSFDRWIVEVYADGINVSDLLVKEGHAEYQVYR
jgi:micrococcal nuclease